jgi:hypothetical protein
MPADKQARQNPFHNIGMADDDLADLRSNFRVRLSKLL